MKAAAVQVAGGVACAFGVGWWSRPAGIITAGVFLLVFGVAMERG